MLNDTDRSGLDKFLASDGRVALRRVRDGDAVLIAGAMLGNWRVEAFLGRGGSGEVYRVVWATGTNATQRTIGTDGRARSPSAPQLAGNAFALKILWRDDESSRKRFAAELRLLAENQSPYLPQLFASGEWRGHPYFVTELLEPVDLPSADSAVAAYLLSVCESVASLHRIGIVHRDLKPKNIMRRSSGEVVLIDFGLAKDTFVSPRPRTDVSIVSGKVVGVGTPEYAAPEQLTGGEISPAADIHALGRIANASFGGNPPHSWQAIIRRATSSIPAQRYETVDDFATAIRNRNRFRNWVRIGLVAVILTLFAGAFLGRDELPLVRDLSTQMRFKAICETVATNIVTQQLLWEKLETNKFGMVYLKERAFRNVTNAIDVTLVRLNRGTNMFVRPMQLKPNHEYWVVGPGILDASVTSAGTNTIMRLMKCVFRNRATVPIQKAGIRYVFQKGGRLHFTKLDRPHEFVPSQFEGFDGAFNAVYFRNDPMSALSVGLQSQTGFP